MLKKESKERKKKMKNYKDSEVVNLSYDYVKYKVSNSNDTVFIKKNLRRHIGFTNHPKRFSNNKRG